jgi:molybdopterin synthase sulfur carrier subunit
MASVRVAIDQELTEMSAPLAGAREVAFFPPMTGG